MSYVAYYRGVQFDKLIKTANRLLLMLWLSVILQAHMLHASICLAYLLMYGYLWLCMVMYGFICYQFRLLLS